MRKCMFGEDPEQVAKDLAKAAREEERAQKKLEMERKKRERQERNERNKRDREARRERQNNRRNRKNGRGGKARVLEEDDEFVPMN